MGEETKGTKWGDCWATRRDTHVGGASWAETKVDEDPEVNTAIYPRVKETQPEMVTVTLLDRGPSFWGVEVHFPMEAPS